MHALDPTPVPAPRLIRLNVGLARGLRLDPEVLASPHGVEMLAGNRIAEDAQPIALAYAGHQFGHFVPQLGDGRANLLGEVIGADGQRYDVQLKGSGPTPFSRRGDGRAALGPVLREYVLSEAMAALGVPTTRALAAVATGEPVYRETVQPGAVFVRVAASHLRVGTFQYFAARGDTDAVRTLADYAIARHYAKAAEAEAPYRELLDGVIERHARLVAQWVLIGFIHGVMNTDNTSISGETIDYGPCAFMEGFDREMVFSSIDHQGRYAYENQPRAALWNLTRLAESLLPLLESETGSAELGLASAKAALAGFEPEYESARLKGLRAKLGLLTERPEDASLAEGLLDLMAANGADFTLTFRALIAAAEGLEGKRAARALFADAGAWDAWALSWQHRLAQETASSATRAEVMRRANPSVIPRNHLIEEMIVAAVERQDFVPFEQMLEAIQDPYRECSDRYTRPAREQERVLQTFCGT